MSNTESKTLLSKLREAGLLGADLSPGDPLCAAAADFIDGIKELADECDKKAEKSLDYAQKYDDHRAEAGYTENQLYRWFAAVLRNRADERMP